MYKGFLKMMQRANDTEEWLMNADEGCKTNNNRT